MAYKLFIDDERDPITNDWVIARTSEEALKIVRSKGFPIEISFDHDLGGDDTSMKFLHTITEDLIEKRLTLPPVFTYSIHSQNPVGAENIRGLMNVLIVEFSSNLV